MNTAEFSSLVDTNQVNLAAAYAILMSNGEIIMLRSFQDIIDLTRRIKIAEMIIKCEKDTECKRKISERINWHKTNIRKALLERKTYYATMITAEKADDNCVGEFYNRVIDAIDSRYEDFYKWIFSIDEISNIRGG